MPELIQPVMQKLLGYGIGGVFIIYLVVMNWRFQNQIDLLNRKHEVGVEKTVSALTQIREALSAIKAILYSRRD